MMGVEVLHEWVDARFAEQVDSWLEYICNNSKHQKYRRTQTGQMGLSSKHRGKIGKSTIGQICPRRNNHRNGLRNYAINNWELYKDWKNEYQNKLKTEHSDKPKGSKWTFIYLGYVDAVPILHDFLDYYEDTTGIKWYDSPDFMGRKE